MTDNVRPFAAILQDLRRGEVLDLAAAELQAIVKVAGDHIATELGITIMRGIPA